MLPPTPIYETRSYSNRHFTDARAWQKLSRIDFQIGGASYAENSAAQARFHLLRCLGYKTREAREIAFLKR